MNINLEYKPTEKQKLFHICEATYTLFGGAKGGGKTVALCNESIQLSLDYAGNRGFLCRRQYSDFKISTLLTLMAWIPTKLIKKHSKGDKYIEFLNGSILYYGGLDEESNINKLNSAEFGFFAVDQAEEIDADDYIKLGGTLRLKLKKGIHPHYRGILSANPAPGWLKQTFIKNPPKDHVFIQSLPKDNPHLEQSYINRLKQLYRNRPDLLSAYIYGNWEELEGSDTIIPSQKIYDAVARKAIDKSELKKVVCCDPSTSQGENETVIYVLENGDIMSKRVFSRRTFMEIAAILSATRKNTNSDLIAFDSSGIGIGVREELDKLKETYLAVNTGEKSRFPKRFRNKKAEAWWLAADMFGDGLMRIEDDPVLINQLSSVKYKLNSSPIQVEDKKLTIKRLGNSPDRADALVIGLYALQFAPKRKGTSVKKQKGNHWYDRYSKDHQEVGSFMSC